MTPSARLLSRTGKEPRILTLTEQNLLRLGELEIDAVMETRYGQKSGDGPNTGKTAIRYRIEFPDGSVHHKRSFTVREQEAVAGVFTFAGTLHIAGIWASQQEFETMHGSNHGYTFLKAVKV
jgi:hypothetical protein